MALTVLQATANTTPDPGLGGAAVTTPSNTGHASSSAIAVGAASQTKSCRWSGFPSDPTVNRTAVTLKVTSTRDGSLSDGGVVTSNQFLIEYSLNGGGAWTTIRNETQLNTALGPDTDSVTLPLGQDLTQVMVRDKMFASSVAGESAVMTATVSGIQIEVTTSDAQGQATVIF